MKNPPAPPLVAVTVVVVGITLVKILLSTFTPQKPAGSRKKSPATALLRIVWLLVTTFTVPAGAKGTLVSETVCVVTKLRGENELVITLSSVWLKVWTKFVTLLVMAVSVNEPAGAL